MLPTAFIALVATALISLASAGLYVGVGRLIVGRPASGDALLANRLFGVWWISLGLVSLLSALTVAALVGGFLDVPLITTIITLTVMFLAIGLWGLMYYLLFLYTGSRRILVPLTIGYSLLGIVMLYAVAWLKPIGVEESAFAVKIVYENQLSAAPLATLTLLLSGPVLIAAGAYGSLFFRLEDSFQRYRVAMVSSGFVLWFGWSVIASVTGVSAAAADTAWLAIANRSLGLVVPLFVLFAYRPPAFAVRRLAA